MISTIAIAPAARVTGACAAPRPPVAASSLFRPATGAAVALQQAATFAGFGQIRYTEAAGSAPVPIAPGIRTPLTFVFDPTQTQNALNAPFAGHLAFDGTTITPRALNDAIFILANLSVTAAVAGGAVKVDVDVGSPLGPTGSSTETLFNAAGAPERVTCILYVQTLSYFMANGAKLFITASVPVSLVNESVVLIPQSTHPTA